MSFVRKFGQFALNTGTGDQTVDTGTGIEGKILRLFASKSTTETSEPQSNGCVGIGIAGPKQCVLSWVDDDNESAIDSGTSLFSTAILNLMQSGSVVADVSAEFVSFGTGGDAGKFTINITNAPDGGAYLVYYEFIGGTDITDVDLLEYAASTTLGNRDDTGASFTPDAAFSIAALQTVKAATVSGRVTIGLSLSSSKRWTIVSESRDGQTMTGRMHHYQSDTRCLAWLLSAAVNALADHVAFISGGRTLNWVDAASGAYIYFTLYVKGGQWDCGTFSSPTSGGTPQDQVVSTAVPVHGAAFFGVGADTAMNTAANKNGILQGGGYNPGTVQEAVVASRGQDVIPTDTNTVNASTKCVAVLNPTVVEEADYKEQAADSFTVTWSTLDAAAIKYFWYGVGPNAGAAAFALDAQPGAFTLSGIAIGALASRIVDAQAGAYSLSGVAAGVLAGRMVDAATGAYILTGVAASLQAGRALSLDPGAYTLTGSVADLIASSVGAFELSADPGVYALTGVNAAILADRMIDAALGVYQLTGAEASVVAQRMIAADPGAYVLSGVDAELVFSPVAGAFVLNAEPGSYLITGIDAALAKDIEDQFFIKPLWWYRGRR